YLGLLRRLPPQHAADVGGADPPVRRRSGIAARVRQLGRRRPAGGRRLDQNRGIRAVYAGLGVRRSDQADEEADAEALVLRQRRLPSVLPSPVVSLRRSRGYRTR